MLSVQNVRQFHLVIDQTIVHCGYVIVKLIWLVNIGKTLYAILTQADERMVKKTFSFYGNNIFFCSIIIETQKAMDLKLLLILAVGILALLGVIAGIVLYVTGKIGGTKVAGDGGNNTTSTTNTSTPVEAGTIQTQNFDGATGCIPTTPPENSDVNPKEIQLGSNTLAAANKHGATIEENWVHFSQPASEAAIAEIADAAYKDFSSSTEVSTANSACVYFEAPSIMGGQEIYFKCEEIVPMSTTDAIFPRGTTLQRATRAYSFWPKGTGTNICSSRTVYTKK